MRPHLKILAVFTCGALLSIALLGGGTRAAAAGMAASPGPAASPAPAAGLDEAAAARFAAMALACVHREYPNKISHVLNGKADVRPPHSLTPAFYGCFDWHSAVHGHWLLARLTRTFPRAAWAAAARAALDESLTPEHIAAEVEYLSAPGRESFERPYGLAWLLQLDAELREWDDPQARRWSETLAPLSAAAATRLCAWLPKLTHPIRTGEHNQTAFALGLVLDWARRGTEPIHRSTATLVAARALELYQGDRDCPLAYEPSGEDFLSPCLAEADLLRRLLPADRFAAWLDGFLPRLPRRPEEAKAWLSPGLVTDPTDGKLVHLDGLNLSRAWMLRGIAAGLPAGDPRRAALAASAALHGASGLDAVTGEHGARYEGGHWLGTFAVYLTTGRGLPEAAR